MLNLSASAAASDLCEWVQVRIDVYIPHHKCHVKPHSSAAFAATIVHRNHFFPLQQQNKSSESKRKFRQSSSKWFLKLLNLHMLIKEKSLSLPRNLDLGTSAKLPIKFLTQLNLLYFLYSTTQRCCLLHLIK